MKEILNTNLNSNMIGQEVVLNGWVNKKRNLGGLLFIDLRDCSGLIQLVFEPENKHYSQAVTLSNESVIQIKGKVRARTNKNKYLKTGAIEINVRELKVINLAQELPFGIGTEAKVSEETKLKYRYLDLRRKDLITNLTIRHQIKIATHNFLDQAGFLEIETPILCKPTPEGARDYLVPSRVNQGCFYALPQSPQLFKQLLMMGSIEKYYQIARCIRDEDLRSDRQPEFTQIDLEMSFVSENDVMELTEKLIAYLFQKIKGIQIQLPLTKIKYDTAINDYGSDKPDLRFGLKINDITAVFKNTKIDFLKNWQLNQGTINAIVIPDGKEKYSRKAIDQLTKFLKDYQIEKLIYLKYDTELDGSLVKMMSSEEKKDLITRLNLQKGDLVLITGGAPNLVKPALGALRNKIARDLGLIKANDNSILWVTDFPLFEWNSTENRFKAAHHPFTAPKDETLLNNPILCYGQCYDLVINGFEIGSGSLRIHQAELQKKIFKILGLSETQIKTKFGFFLEALKYGTPPHGGIALGLDRLTMIFANTENIKDVIAFPKTATGADLMSNSPNQVSPEQLKELGLRMETNFVK